MIENKLAYLRKQWKLAKTDIDRAIIEARASLIKRGYQTLGDKNDIKLVKDVKDTLY